jgi:hypothetical protein
MAADNSVQCYVREQVAGLAQPQPDAGTSTTWSSLHHQTSPTPAPTLLAASLALSSATASALASTTTGQTG